MRSASTHLAWLPLLAAGVSTCPQSAGAQSFSAYYGLSRPGMGQVGPDDQAPSARFSLGPVRIGPALQSQAAGVSGAGLSFEAGRNWFAQVGLGRSLQPRLVLSNFSPYEVLSIAGGYRWIDGQSLSLQVTGGQGAERLGLSVGYDWPRYFVRMTYDSKLRLTSQDNLRFSAGLRF